MSKQNTRKTPIANAAEGNTKAEIKNLQNQLSQQNKVKLFFSLLIVAFAFAIYANSLNNEYALDDFSVIKENNIVKNGTKAIPLIFNSSYRYGYLNVNDGLYRPFTLMMYAIEWQIFPDKPAVYHFINILLYAITGVVLFRLLIKALKDTNIILPLAATLLFIAHPIHTEVVANIKSSDEITCFLLSVTSLSLLFDYLNTKKTSKIIFALLSYSVALFCKESAVLLLAFIPLFMYFFTDIKIGKIVLQTSIFLIPTLLYLGIRQKVLGTGAGLDTVSLADNLLMAAKNPIEKIATAFVVLLYYIKLLIVPHPLLYNYSYNQIPIVNFSNIWALCSLLLHLALLAFALINLKKKHLLSFAILFYFIGISLFSNLVITIGAAMGERFIYFSSFGFCIAVAYLILKLFKVDLHTPITKPALVFTSKPFAISLVVIVALFSIKTIARNPDWKNNLTLYKHDLPISMNSVRSHYYYGNELIKMQDELSGQPIDTAAILEGCKQLKLALEIFPEYNDANTQLGVAYYKIKDYKNSEKYYLITLNNNRNDAVAINNLAAIYFNTGQYIKAIEMYERAIVLNPRFTDALVNIGSCYGQMQKYRESIEFFKRAIDISPDNSKAYFFLSKSYGFLGQQNEAKQAMAQAQSLDPNLK